jgi:hypothetical protein
LGKVNATAAFRVPITHQMFRPSLALLPLDLVAIGLPVASMICLEREKIKLTLSARGRPLPAIDWVGALLLLLDRNMVAIDGA